MLGVFSQNLSTLSLQSLPEKEMETRGKGSPARKMTAMAHSL